MPPVISRRSFIEKVGFGAGGALLAPIAQSLVQEARGQVPDRKRFLAFLSASGLQWDGFFVPPEFGGSSARLNATVMGETAFTWPAFIQPLEKYRSRMLIVDGLGNVPTTKGADFTHTVAYSALSCVPNVKGAQENVTEFGLPGGITIDQVIANGIGGGTAKKSILFGRSQNYLPNEVATVFATGPSRPEIHTENPPDFWRQLFSGVTGGQPVQDLIAERKRILFDVMKQDINRLQSRLAGTERRKFQDYLAVISDLEGRIAAAPPPVSCAPPAAPGTLPTYEDKLEAMFNMATIALVCGLTNVVGVSAGCGNSHSTLPETFPRLGVTYNQHWAYEGGAMAAAYNNALTKAHQFFSGLVARMLDSLSGVTEGNRTIADSLLGIYTTDNGEQHHSNKQRWPIVVIGDAGAGRKLQSGGRFFRYPISNSDPGRRALADMYATVARACGVDADTFGRGGNLPAAKGPIADLLV